MKSIKTKTQSGEVIRLTLYPDSDAGTSLWKIEESEAAARGEAQLQIQEGFSYEYSLSEGFQLAKVKDIVHPSQSVASAGRITPQLYVGTLTLPIINSAEKEVGRFEVEVRSTKARYREDYRYMLESIADQSTSLILSSKSPAYQRLTFDYQADPKTLYQRFAFVRSMLLSDKFDQAVQRILNHPASSWTVTEEKRDIRRIRRFSGKDLRKIASSQNRQPLPAGHSLKSKISSLPSRLATARKTRDLDTPENRFIKHALSEFMSFCTSMRQTFKDAGRGYHRAVQETHQLESLLADHLNRDFFRRLSYPESLPLNSPILQRKEGYRYILRTWLHFDLAAKLIWSGGEDVYPAGKRDVARLYEYWLFFILKELIEEVFDLQAVDLSSLFETTKNGIDLQLKAGRQTVISGVFKNPVRDLAVGFSYNRTFSQTDHHHAEGSWTRRMRPDFTLSLWPEGLDKSSAETQELMIHIHFDAKYRVQNLQEILGEGESPENQEVDTADYQPEDLLKMHAYKDAIRRTAGAYILYPGRSGQEILRGFHEIIPGLGAFAVRPSETDNGTAAVKEFLQEISAHLLNRAAQREQWTYHTYDIFKAKKDTKIREPLPEFTSGVRTKPPSETFVLVGYCKSTEHYQWIIENGLYNFRLTGRGAISKHVDPKMLAADYILLHWAGHSTTRDIYPINQDHHLGPRRMTAGELIQIEYPKPGHEEYLVYQISPKIVREFAGAAWDLRHQPAYRSGRAVGLPFAVTLAKLMKSKS